MIRLFLATYFLLIVAGSAHAHDGLPVVVSLEQKAAHLYLLRLLVPPSIPDGQQPQLIMFGGCELRSAQKSLADCPRSIGGTTLRLVWKNGKPAVPTLVRITWRSGEVRSLVAEPGETDITLPNPESAILVFGDYAKLGVEHILTGWDHLAFLMCLAIIASGRRRLVLTVTGFTMGHAISITAASLGLAGLPGPVVEAAIALSIMFVAAEILKPIPKALTRRYPVIVASLFGLLHGFGFARALHDIGLPQTELPLALLSFNLGIEAGQLAFLAAIMVLWGAMHRASRFMPNLATLLDNGHVQTAVAWSIGFVAAFWFVQRLPAIVGPDA